MAAASQAPSSPSPDPQDVNAAASLAGAVDLNDPVLKTLREASKLAAQLKAKSCIIIFLDADKLGVNLVTPPGVTINAVERILSEAVRIIGEQKMATMIEQAMKQTTGGPLGT